MRTDQQVSDLESGLRKLWQIGSESLTQGQKDEVLAAWAEAQLNNRAFNGVETTINDI